jgi:hypothetical protein
VYNVQGLYHGILFYHAIPPIADIVKAPRKVGGSESAILTAFISEPHLAEQCFAMLKEAAENLATLDFGSIAERRCSVTTAAVERTFNVDYMQK